jgi:shikimate kinase
MLVFLVGMMGSGKSYWGRKLATHLDMAWRDLDQDVEMGERSAVHDLFQQHGEAGFRVIEQLYLHRTYPPAQPTIVSTGGGAPCFFDNMAWMNQHGTTIWLAPESDIIATRIWPERHRRPLLKDVQLHDLQQFVKQKLRERVRYYAQAQHTFTPEAYSEADFLEVLAGVVRR